MKQGFVKVAAASCAVVVADVRENTRVILETIHKNGGRGSKGDGAPGAGSYRLHL